MKQKVVGEVHFHYLFKSFTLNHRKLLKEFILIMLERNKRPAEVVNIVFCDDAYLLSLNKKHLKHNTYTDIITFELSPKDQLLLADIYISVERVKENAAQFNTAIKKEIHRVLFHGLLHCCGFKDKTEKDIEDIRRAENACLDEYEFHVKLQKEH